MSTAGRCRYLAILPLPALFAATVEATEEAIYNADYPEAVIED